MISVKKNLANKPEVILVKVKKMKKSRLAQLGYMSDLQANMHTITEILDTCY